MTIIKNYATYKEYIINPVIIILFLRADKFANIAQKSVAFLVFTFDSGRQAVHSSELNIVK